MDDLISRAAAMRAFSGKPGEYYHPRYIVGELKDLPAVDAVPVVHGRWISYPERLAFEGAYHDEHIVCSACHSVWNIIDNDTERFDYCPNCGAKMDGERRDDNGKDA